MSTINRAPFNALVDDTGTGTTGTVWNKAQIKAVILDPGDLAWGRGMTLVKAAEGSDTDPTYHALDSIPFIGMTTKDIVLMEFQFQSSGQPVNLVIFKSGAAAGAIAIGASEVLVGRYRLRAAATQPTIATGSIEAMTTYPSAARRDSGFWAGTSEAWTAPWSLQINNGGVSAGTTFYYSYSVYVLSGQ